MGLLAGYLLRDKTSFLVILENRINISYQILLPKMYCDPTVRKWSACQCYGRKCSEDVI